MTTALVPNGNGSSMAEYTTAQVDVIRNTIARDCTDNELALFIGACKRSGLDPLQKQIYAMKLGGKLSIQTSIDGFRVIAERSGKYRGQVGPFWCGDDGKWVDVWLAKTPPAAARVGVLHRDFAEPLWGVARTASYSRGSGLWAQMPEVMIAKVAEALALRKAFPNDLSGLYTADEMDQSQGGTPKRQEKPRTVAEFKEQSKAIADSAYADGASEPETTRTYEDELNDAAAEFLSGMGTMRMSYSDQAAHRAAQPPVFRNPDGPEPPADAPPVEPTGAEADLLEMVAAIENIHHAKKWKVAHRTEVNMLDAAGQARIKAAFFARFPTLAPKT